MKTEKELLLEHLDAIHTTLLGADRIRKNLNVDEKDIVAFCKQKIKEENACVYRNGKNWYCEIDHMRFTINASSYTIITAHKSK